MRVNFNRRVMGLCGGIFVLLCTLSFNPGMANAMEMTKDNGEVKSFRGILKTGIVAIGGESTGTGLVTEEGPLELSFEQMPGLEAVAKKMNGRKVLVQGKLVTRQGVEIPIRRIIVVQELKLDEES